MLFIFYRSVIAFELTGQMTHIIPVIISVLIANAIAQSLELSIYDSIIQIKKLPFLPPILSTSSAAYNILVEDIMVRDVAFIWKNCSYHDLKALLKSHSSIHSFPFVDDPKNMILLGSVQRNELTYLAQQHLTREKRLQEVKRRNSIEKTLKQVAAAVSESKSQTSSENTTSSRRLSRFEVTPVQGSGSNEQLDNMNNLNPPSPNRLSPRSPMKSILKQTVSITYSPHSTVTLAAQGNCLCININIYNDIYNKIILRGQIEK